MEDRLLSHENTLKLSSNRQHPNKRSGDSRLWREFIGCVLDKDGYHCDWKRQSDSNVGYGQKKGDSCAVQFMQKLFLILVLSPVLQGQSGHSVTLTWQASPDAAANPTLSYNVYKGTGACSSNPTFTKIASPPAGVLTFSDPNVSVGQTLCYQVTAVLNGLESKPMQAPTVLIPPAPHPTTELTPAHTNISFFNCLQRRNQTFQR